MNDAGYAGEEMRRFPFLLLLLILLPSFAAGTEPAITLVVCAPGYPGNTEQAQPVMDDLAAQLARGAGWEMKRLAAVYHRKLDAGLEQLARDDTALVLVPLPFFLEYRERLGLEALLEVVHDDGKPESFSLVAARGAVAGPAALADFEIVGMPGYSPRFVRRVALADWGQLPDGARIDFNDRIISALRKAAAGEKLAVLLDGPQAGALGALPFAADLEVVAESPPMIGSLVAVVGGRLSDDAVRALTAAFTGLEEAEESGELLQTLGIARFRPVDPPALMRILRAFDGEKPEAEVRD